MRALSIAGLETQRRRTRPAAPTMLPLQRSAARQVRRCGALARPHRPLATTTHISEMPPSRRSNIRSFKVMDVVAAANSAEENGRKICRLEIGQPQSAAPKAAIALAQAQLSADRCGYTAARGEVPLRDEIAAM